METDELDLIVEELDLSDCILDEDDEYTESPDSLIGERRHQWSALSRCKKLKDFLY